MTDRRTSLQPLAVVAALGVLLLAGAAVAVWFLFGGGLQGDAASASPGAGGPEPAEAPAPSLRSPGSGAGASEDAERAGRALAPTDAERALQDAVWVEGRVVLPPKTPADERALVVARGRDSEDGVEHRAEVAGDGSFRAAFARGTETGELDLEARYLYLEAPVPVEVGESRDPVVLEAKLGGRIAASFLPPDTSEELARGIVGSEVGLVGMLRRGTSMRMVLRRSRDMGEDLSVEFDQLSPELRYDLSLRGEGLAPAGSAAIAVTPGETVRLEIGLVPGANLSGRVVDPFGAGVPRAKIDAAVTYRREGGTTIDSAAAEADGEGRFALAGLRGGTVELRAEAEGFAPELLEVGELAAGEVRTGLEIALGRGEAILGRVQWPDGTPAAGARVELGEVDPAPRKHFSSDRRLEGHADAAGSFRFAGLGPGPYELRAEAAAEGGEEGDPPWRAVRSGAMPADSPLTLVLAPTLFVEGRVVDDIGAPVTSFSVSASPRIRGDLDHGRLPERASGRFEDAQGRFRLEGVGEGVWNVSAHAKGHYQRRPATLELPRESRGIEIVLPRAASVRGTVSYPGDVPAEDAEVRLSASVFSDGTYQRDERTSRPEAGGAFAIDDVPPGTAWLAATRAGWAPSENLRLDLAPAQELSGVVLRLRPASRITGEVRAAEPLARSVHLRPLGGGERLGSEFRSTESDGDGRFAFEAVPPGRYRVLADPPEGTVAARQWELEWLALRLAAEVEVAGGEDAHVVLGGASPSAVLLHGVVRRAGVPVERAPVTASGPGRVRTTATVSGGRYELTLDGPGEYWVTCGGPRGSTQRMRRVRVPDAERFALDLELPSGSIAGRVVGLEGEPAYAYVMLEETSLADGVWGHEETGEGGGFRFEDLPAGSYLLTARVTSIPESGPAPSAPRRRIELGEGQAIEGLELRLEPGASIEGSVVTSAGQPATGARVRLHFEDGSGSTNLPSAQTDARGRYRFTGLSAGRWRASAASDSEASAASDPVELAPGSRAEIDLLLRPATLLRAIVERPDGTHAFASVYSIAGPGRSESLRLSPWTSDPAEGIVVALLPPGTWRIAAELEGLRAEQSISLSGEPERTVLLRLAGK